MTEIQGILLAAGAGVRFGSNKLLHPLPSGELIGLEAARNLINPLPRSLAVIRQGDTKLAQGFKALGLQIVENNRADLGMGGSLAMGIAASANAAGWIVALADMPWIAPETILTLAKRLEKGASLCAPVYRGRRGHPVGFGGQWLDQLMALQGDRGARYLLQTHPRELVLLDTRDPGVLLDIDHDTDLNAQG
jgi:molybdenum cofactor cytidylyltransferase